MSKPKTTETEAKIRALEKVASDKKRPKKVRKAAKAEIDALKGTFVPSEATGATEAEPSSPSTAEDAPVSSPDASTAGDAWRERQDAEVARQWSHHSAQLAKTTLVVPKPQVEHEIVAPFPAERIQVDDDGVIRFLPEEGPVVFTRDDLLSVYREEHPEAQEGDPYRAALEEAAAADPNLAKHLAAQEARIVETEDGREIVVGAPTIDVLAKPDDPVLTNGNGQPIITYLDPATGKEKTKGYTRVTVYIDCLEDKSNLDKWRMRVLLEGGAVELLQNDGASPSLESVGRAVGRLDAALADIDRRTKEEGELLGLRRVELLKEHRDHLAKIAEDLLELGGAHEAATKGTDLHRLTEIVDNGQPLPAGVSASDRRDVEAYQAAMGKLGAEVLWTERRIVLDDLQVSGTMDRAYLVKLPGMARRVRVVGDLKTGRIDYSQGKIGMQLALYARGLGYDWTKPLERERLSLNQHHGLLVHLPQGEGRCTVYLVDLELAGKGLGLAKSVREWRNEGKRVFDMKAPLVAVEA